MHPLEKRALQKGKLIAACSGSKVAYFVMDKLVIKEGHFSSGRQSQDPTENQQRKPLDSDPEILFDPF